MHYVDQTFVDEVVHLDGNTFERCTFEGCVLHFDGGEVRLIGPIDFKTENRIKYGPGIDASDNPLTKFLVDGFIEQGGVPVDPNAPEEPRAPPKKDLR